MPLTERFVRDRDFRILEACGATCSLNKATRSGFFADEGYATFCSTRMDRSFGTVIELGSKDGSKYSISVAMAALLY
jgi:hypothetical protein